MCSALPGRLLYLEFMFECCSVSALDRTVACHCPTHTLPVRKAEEHMEGHSHSADLIFAAAHSLECSRRLSEFPPDIHPHRVLCSITRCHHRYKTLQELWGDDSGGRRRCGGRKSFPKDDIYTNLHSHKLLNDGIHSQIRVVS